MRHHSHEDTEIDMRHDTQDEWHPWCETVGFIIRRITRRRFNVYREFNAKRRCTGDHITVEFDILSGLSGDYVTTGLWSFNPDTLLPLGEPVCTPVSFEQAFSSRRICVDFPPSLARGMLMDWIQRHVEQDGSDDSLEGPP